MFLSFFFHFSFFGANFLCFFVSEQELIGWGKRKEPQFPDGNMNIGSKKLNIVIILKTSVKELKSGREGWGEVGIGKWKIHGFMDDCGEITEPQKYHVYIVSIQLNVF